MINLPRDLQIIITYKTTNMTNENVKPVNGSVNSFIVSSVKRDTPIKYELKDLFRFKGLDDSDYKPFHKDVLFNYYNDLSPELRLNLESLFIAINNNILINPKRIDSTGENLIEISITNQYLDKTWSFRLPYYNDLWDFIVQYRHQEVSCEITFDTILTFLQAHK